MTRIVAVAIDAAEASLVRALADAGELPFLASLARHSGWTRVTSPADIGSGAVWPSFFTGLPASEHGVHSEWAWDPSSMTLRPYDGQRHLPFWREAPGTFGVMDVPFARFGDVRNGFELFEWGPHDALERRTRATPGAAAAAASDIPHPFTRGRDDLDACIEGAAARGAVASRLIRDCATDSVLIVFTEVHHASHLAWHTLDEGPQSPLRTLLPAVDQQLSVIADAAGTAAAFVVFSLHGMRKGRGLAQGLQQVLLAGGYASLSGWRTQSWRERAISAFGALKRRSPPLLKKLYYRALPSGATLRLAQPTMLPPYDWSRTRAFSLPSDQHGWVRVNLRGREVRGVVEERDYETTLLGLETLLRELRDESGRPLVEKTFRTNAPAAALPDLVVHWTDAALTPHASGKVLTGQHATDGFLVARGVDVGATIAAEDIHRLLVR